MRTAGVNTCRAVRLDGAGRRRPPPAVPAALDHGQQGHRSPARRRRRQPPARRRWRPCSLAESTTRRPAARCSFSARNSTDRPVYTGGSIAHQRGHVAPPLCVRQRAVDTDLVAVNDRERAHDGRLHCAAGRAGSVRLIDADAVPFNSRSCACWITTSRMYCVRGTPVSPPTGTRRLIDCRNRIQTGEDCP